VVDTASEELAKALSCPWAAYLHADSVIKGRWPEGESLIASDVGWSYYYARDVIKGRFPEGEAIIATEPGWALHYIRDVIQGRWPEAEPLIMKSECSKSYMRDIISGNWAYEGEEMWWILQTRI
jgi:hypothetical protein